MVAAVELLKRRNRSDTYWSDLLAGTTGSAQVRCEFSGAFASDRTVALEHPDVLPNVAVYCLLHAAFDSD